MHIPSSMLNGAICPVTAVVSALSIGGVAFAAAKAKEKPSAMRFGAVSAFIFASQMMNFPVLNGTSGHLLGGVLASALIGVPFGVLATALVVLIQALVFSDGGMSVLGANILNMALIGAGIGGWLFKRLAGASDKDSIFHLFALGMAAWLSVILASFACSIELGISGTIAFSKVARSMLGIHALIGIGEGLITCAMCKIFSIEVFSKTSKGSVGAPLAASVLIAAVLSPFASSFPDGLEWVAEKYKFFHESVPSFVSPLSNYVIPCIPHSMASTACAGVLGVLITFGTVLLLARSSNWKRWTLLQKEV